MLQKGRTATRGRRWGWTEGHWNSLKTWKKDFWHKTKMTKGVTLGSLKTPKSEMRTRTLLEKRKRAVWLPTGWRKEKKTVQKMLDLDQSSTFNSRRNYGHLLLDSDPSEKRCWYYLEWGSLEKILFATRLLKKMILFATRLCKNVWSCRAGKICQFYANTHYLSAKSVNSMQICITSLLALCNIQCQYCEIISPQMSCERRIYHGFIAQ